MKARIVEFIIGNMGAGKTTLARKLIDKGFVVLDNDYMREMLGCGKYIFSPETEPIIKKISMEFISELSARNINFVIDGCMVTKALRAPIISTIREESNYNGIKTVINARVLYVSKDVALKRRMKNPRGISKEVWAEVWDKFNLKWQDPERSEGFDKIIKDGKL